MSSTGNKTDIEKFLKQVYLAQNAAIPSSDWKQKLMFEISNISVEKRASEARLHKLEVKFFRFAWLSFAVSTAAAVVIAAVTYFTGESNFADEPVISAISETLTLKDS